MKLTQEQARELVAEHGSPAKAAKALGRSENYVRKALDRDAANAKQNAYRAARRSPRGPAMAPTVPHVPEGHEIIGVSTLLKTDDLTQWTKTGKEGAETAPLPPDFTVRKISTMTVADGTTRVKWTGADRSKTDAFEAFKIAAKQCAEEYRGLVDPTLAPRPRDLTDTLTTYPLGDPHVGMLSWLPETGEHNDLRIATNRMRHAIDLAVDGAPPSREAWVINLGDFWHAPDQRQVTPGGGNKVDVDGRHTKVLRAGLDVMRYTIDRALAKHEQVWVGLLPGNHDDQMSAMLSLMLEGWYHREPRVEISDGLRSFVYRRWRTTLFGLHHGHGARPEALPEIMAADQVEAWGATEFHNWYTGHVHHTSRKDFRACEFESFRITAPGDAWHVSKGYRARRSQHAITYDESGEFTRATIDIKKIAQRAIMAEERETA